MRIESLLAPNPGLFTGPGTNTYLIRSGDMVAVIDPGPVIADHRAAIEAAVGEAEVKAIIVTHTHPDHAPLANPLARQYSVPAVGYAAGPEFEPDLIVEDGDTIQVGDTPLDVLYTPGHADDHICLRAGRFLFTGDHIMGGSTVMVEDLVAYLDSLARLRKVEIDRMFPGHGPEIDNPDEIIEQYIDHRLDREQQIIAAVQSGAASIGAVVEDVYADVDQALHRIAAMSVAAHLRKLHQEGILHFEQREELWDSLVQLAAPR